MSQKIKDPGFGFTSSSNAGRVLNKNGRFNFTHINKDFHLREAYNFLIRTTWLKFFTLVFVSYIVVNLFFASMYMLTGIEEVVPKETSAWLNFLNAFFFSAQTLTTLGYGSMSPSGVYSGFISSFEALFGLLMFSAITGLLYGKFSRPKASIKFSKHIVLRDFNVTKALMFRLVNNRKSIMIKPKVSVILSMSEKNKNGNYTNQFYNLNLERKSIDFLPTTWTIVHELDKGSPLSNYTKEQLKTTHGELIILISYFDEAFNQEVHQMHSYTLDELKVDYEFEKAYYFNKKGKIVIDHKLLDAILPVNS